MTDLVVRRLMVDLEQPFERRWNGGDAFSSAFLNALSMSFPVGEQFFIDALRRGVLTLPLHERAARDVEVQGFIGQEATHRRLHALFNAQLVRLGLHNHWEERVQRRLHRFASLEPRHWLAVTAAYEHFTAILAEHLLAHPELVAGAEPRLQRLWFWHSAEECEHKSTAFDFYRLLKGDERRRRRWFLIVTGLFLLDVTRQTLNNLWHDRALARAATWTGAWRFLFGRHGVVPGVAGAWCDYLRADFHPSQHDSARGPAWLAAHADEYILVVRPLEPGA